MSPKVLEERGLIFWFHSYDALHEDRASVHVGKGSQDDRNDAKIWLEPEIAPSRRASMRRPSLVIWFSIQPESPTTTSGLSGASAETMLVSMR